MNLLQCAKAHQALDELMKKEFDYASAHALVVLKNQLQVHIFHRWSCGWLTNSGKKT
jgi:hypothetical protein